MSDRRPVVFLAFANVQAGEGGYLPHLSDEYNRLRAIFDEVEKQERCEVVAEPFASHDQVLGTFLDERYRHRIALFHFAGHSDGYRLLLEAAGGSAVAHAAGFAEFLGQQRGLELVFLNGCANQAQVKGLLDAGVASVIATSTAVQDPVATCFAAGFYERLADQDPVRQAFGLAESMTRTTFGDTPAALLRAPVVSRESPAPPRRELELEDPDVTTAGGWPWRLFPDDGDALGWRLGDAAGPLFGLPPLPRRNLPPRPFRGLEWYREEHAELFFGRGREIRDLYDRLTGIRSGAEPLVLLYGESGVGKSSLLEAGLIPRLKVAQEVRYGRCGGGVPPLATLCEVLGVEPTRSAARLRAAWRTLERTSAGPAARPATLILDQLEEAVSATGNGATGLADLITVLHDVFGQPEAGPGGKIVLSFRKEWLAEIRDQLDRADLTFSELFVQTLKRDEIVEIVLGPTSSSRLRDRYRLTVEPGLPEAVANDLTDPGSATAPTLQVLLTELWNAAEAEAERRFTFDRYHDLKRSGLHLGNFLDKQLEKLGDRHTSGLALDVLAFHTTADALPAAAAHSAKDLTNAYVHRPDASALVQQARGLYLLVTPPGSGEGGLGSRLAHDTLAPLVRHRFDHSTRPGQRARRLLESRAVDWQGDASGALLDETDLERVELGRDGMRAWRPEEVRLVEASRRARDAAAEARQQAAQEEQNKRQQKVQELREQAQRKKQEARRWRILTFLAVFAGLIASFFVISYDQQVRNAEGARKAAREAEVRAQAQATLATARLLNGQALRLSQQPDVTTEQAERAALFAAQAVKLQHTAENRGTLLRVIQNIGGLGTEMRRRDAAVSSLVPVPGHNLVFAGGSTGRISLLDATTLAELAESRKIGDEVTALAVQPRRRVWASVSTVGSGSEINLWDLDNLAMQRPFDAPEVILRPRTRVTGAAFQPGDGSLLATSHGPAGVRLWDIDKRARVGKPLRPGGSVSGVAFSPDGTTLAGGGRQPTKRFSGVVFFWDAKTRRSLGRPILYQSPVTSMAFGGNLLYTGHEDGRLVVTDVARRLKQPAAETHRGSVTGVAVGMDGKLLATASDDGGVFLWDGEENVRLGDPLTTGGAVTTAAFSSDGKLLLTAHAANDQSPSAAAITSWDVDPQSWHRRACAFAARNLEYGEWLQTLGAARPYEKTCAEYEVHDSVITAADERARLLGDIEGARRLYDRAKTLELPVTFDPTVRANRLAARFHRKRGLELTDAGSFQEAAEALSEMGRLFPDDPGRAETLNHLCWRGALASQASTVLNACQEAVSVSVAEAASTQASQLQTAYIRDSRGVARAQMGDFAGAIQDFVFFIEWSRKVHPSDRQHVRLRTLREAWVRKLRDDLDPFDRATLDSMKSEPLTRRKALQQP